MVLLKRIQILRNIPVGVHTENQVNLVSGQIAVFMKFKQLFCVGFYMKLHLFIPCDASVRRVRIKLLDQYGMDMLRHQSILIRRLVNH